MSETATRNISLTVLGCYLLAVSGFIKLLSGFGPLDLLNRLLDAAIGV